MYLNDDNINSLLSILNEFKKINMKNEYNKKYTYRGYEFNICVKLNTKVERGLNGSRFHTIISNCLGHDNYYSKDETVTSEIIEYKIREELNAIREYVDKKLNHESEMDETIQLLTNLGFE